MVLKLIKSKGKLTKMQIAYAKFLIASHVLINAWNEDEVFNYPNYLPSFDEFISDFSILMDKPAIDKTEYRGHDYGND